MAPRQPKFTEPPEPAPKARRARVAKPPIATPKPPVRPRRPRTATAQPTQLGPRGSKLQKALDSLKTFNPAETVMVEEMCRMADRLEAINELVVGKGLANLLHLRRMDDFGEEEGEVVIKVTIDAVLAEGRQLQLAFQRLATALNVESGEAAKGEGDVSDDLAEKRKRDLAARASNRAADSTGS
ncbi:MAG: hypothetical protein JWP85_2122 [Rhodoglobus sp.]|nr:hypothetical protein [Rhodoglobus sp.]